MSAIDYIGGDPRELTTDPRVIDWIEELQARLTPTGLAGDAARAQIAFGITQAQARILVWLCAGRVGSKEALSRVSSPHRIDAYTVLTPNGPNVVGVHICNLRKALRPHGISIETVWGSGWRLTPTERAKVVARIEAIP